MSFTLQPGETLGLVGESGSGKSTTGRAVLRLIEPTHGSVRLRGEELTEMSRKELRRKRQAMQMVFQDPYSSLDPSMTIADSLAEAIKQHEDLGRTDVRERASELLDEVGLGRHHLDRYPYEFSGGQRQRIAIARALAVRPELIVCDEAVSALDVSTQNQIIKLLERLQDQEGVGYLFIAHDLAVVRHISDRVAVMYLGRVVEQGPVEQIFERPMHPYTNVLLSAHPIANPARQRGRERTVLRGELPDPTAPPSGCAFRTRCPHEFEPCATELPDLVEMPNGSFVRCHLHDQGPVLGGSTVRVLPPESRGDRRAATSDETVSTDAE
nr:oligopeptide/dipeptide ABC transporter ATP-binding protein [Ilumatobacter nonamiensis]